MLVPRRVGYPALQWVDGVLKSFHLSCKAVQDVNENVDARQKQQYLHVPL